MSNLMFRDGTVDRDCWNGIVVGNEYNLPDSLDENALIVDIGTHVGSFVQACHDRGARRIISFEADKGNFEIAMHNVGSLPGVTLLNMAVFRSDHLAPEVVYFAGYEKFFDGRVNTGGGNVFANECGVEVSAIQFDDIAPGNDIALLKIDCEGAEWPILYTANTMQRVQRIVGEYHSIPERVERQLALPNYHCTAESLEEFLSDSGFTEIEVQPYNKMHAEYNDGQKIGLFWASRGR